MVRPDSITETHRVPAQLVVWILEQLWSDFGGLVNSKGYRVLDPHVRVLWGDGIDRDGVCDILTAATANSFSAENLVFGMGGGLLQKVDRDTQRFAFKASAIKRGSTWHDIYKQPLDHSKTSKKGRLQLTRFTGECGALTYETLPQGTRVGHTLEYRGPHDQRSETTDVLETVFLNGDLVKSYTLDEVRTNAAVGSA